MAYRKSSTHKSFTTTFPAMRHGSQKKILKGRFKDGPEMVSPIKEEKHKSPGHAQIKKQHTKSYSKPTKIQKEPSDFTSTVNQFDLPTMNAPSEMGQDVDEFS